MSRLPADLFVGGRLVKGSLVGSAGLTYPERPYVYRGTGVDQLPGLVVDPPKSKRKRKAKTSRSRRTPTVSLKPRYTVTPAVRRYLDSLDDEDFLVEPEPKPLDIDDVETWGNWTKAPTPEPKSKPPPKTKTHKPRPAPGWQPMTGTDLDDLLEEIGEDDGPLHEW